MTVSNDKAHALALKLCRCYQYHRLCLDSHFRNDTSYRVPACWAIGGRAGNSRAKKDTVWHRLARFCQQRHIDPVYYIRWALSGSQVLLGRPPEPNQLLAPAMMTAYVANRPKQRQRIALRLKIEVEEAETHCFLEKADGYSPEQAWAYVLGNNALNLSPLLRYCLALILGGDTFERFAARFEERALLQYQSDPEAYEAYWSGLGFPADIAERAERLYDEILAQQL